MENLENNELPSPQDLSASILNLSSVKADEEDLTVVNQSGVDVLKFKDRAFDPAQFSGMGYKILRKRIVEGKNVLLQQDFVANYIHEIRYDFDLNGSTINLPDNVLLKFEGGSLKNGTMVGGSTTKISADIVKIFGANLLFSGSWLIDIVYAEWFGAKSVKFRTEGDIDAVTPAPFKPSQEVLNLTDSGDAINSAIIFSILSGGTVKLLGNAYKINKTINILERTTLITDVNTILYIQLLGSGNKITTHNPNDSSFVNQNLTLPINSLLPNQFLQTDCMKIGINISPVNARLVGGGTISLVLSNYTIGIYMKGTGYRQLDMATGSEIAVKSVGGNGTWTKDVTDLEGKGVPTSTNIVENTFYADLLNKNMYRRVAETWQMVGLLTTIFNVSYRFEVFEGWSSGRIIDPNIRIGDMYGWRGIEIITRTGGWFNEARYAGTISNKDGNYISIFTDYDVVNHDFSAVTIQTDERMGADARILQAVRAGGIKTGMLWDLSWVNPVRAKIAFYLGKFSRYCYLGTIDSYRYLIDLGENNNYQILPNKNNVDSVTYSKYVNILQFATPYMVTDSGSQALFYVEFNRVMSLSEMKNVVQALPENTFRDQAPKQLFDEQPDTGHRIIDRTNNKFGCAIELSVRSSNYGLFYSVKNNAFVLIEYVFNEGLGFPVGDHGVVLYAIDTNRDDTSGETMFKYPLRQHDRSIGINRIYIPITGGEQARVKLFIMSETTVDGLKVDIINIKLLTDNPIGFKQYYNNKMGVSQQRPDACPKGHIYEDTTLGKTLINKGDSTVQNWVELLLEQIGNWTITTGNSITAAVADYSKIGKQVYLAGQLSFSNSYIVNTNLPITLPFTPNYGGVFTVGDLTFTLSNNSTAAQVKSASAGNNKPFQINFKTA